MLLLWPLRPKPERAHGPLRRRRVHLRHRTTVNCPQWRCVRVLIGLICAQEQHAMRVLSTPCADLCEIVIYLFKKKKRSVDTFVKIKSSMHKLGAEIELF